MVLSECHYGVVGWSGCGDCGLHGKRTRLTQGVIKDYLDESKEWQDWMRTFVKFERSLVGKETDQTLRLMIWNSVVFFNYLQVAMGGPREAGTSAQYRQAGDALFEVMDKYQPEYVIAWGKRLWSNMPGERWREGEDIVVDGYHVATGAYFLSNGRQVKVMVVNHPSVGYTWDYWNRVIQDFLL